MPSTDPMPGHQTIAGTAAVAAAVLDDPAVQGDGRRSETIWKRENSHCHRLPSVRICQKFDSRYILFCWSSHLLPLRSICLLRSTPEPKVFHSWFCRKWQRDCYSPTMWVQKMNENDSSTQSLCSKHSFGEKQADTIVVKAKVTSKPRCLNPFRVVDAIWVNLG